MEDLHQANKKHLVGSQLSVDDMLDRADRLIDTNIKDVESLLATIATNPRPLDQQQRHRLILLQANRLILEDDLEQADDILGHFMRQKHNASIMIRVIYFRALIAEKSADFDRAFLYLHRLEQYPRPSISVQQQFDILALATNLYTKADELSQATGYAQRALSIARQSKSPRLVCDALRFKSDVYLSAKDFERLKNAAIEAIDACAGEPVALAASYISLSYWHREQQDYDAQRQWIAQAIQLYQQHHFVAGINSANLLLAEAYLLDNDMLNADRVLSAVLSDVEQLKLANNLVLAYRIKAMLFEKSGLPDDAMRYFKKYLAVQNTSKGLKRRARIAYLQSHFENKIDQQAGIFSLIERRNIELIAKAEKLTYLMIVTSSLLFLSISFYCFTFYRRRKSVSMHDRSKLDQLTQLFNPSHGFSLARKMLQTSCHHHTSFGVICINLDFMSAVNNSFSHDLGDIVLQSFANKINCLVSEYGIVVRQSGDHFIAFIPNLDQKKLTDLVIQLHCCLDDLMIDRQKIIVSCSIGWTMQLSAPSVELSENLALLIEQASQALHQAKFNGRNQWVRYQPGEIDGSLAAEDYRSLH